MQETDSLLRTKLHLPFIRPELVPRPRLQEHIARGLRGPLTLVAAPAGFGKTTLVASCVTDCGMPMAWLSLSKDDDQVERFLNYLVAALQEVDGAVGRESAQLLAEARPAPPATVLTSLINDLDAAGRDTALVLDDYQSIRSQAVHELVALLLDHCPKTFHVVIATRSDPPLPLTRLRARGQMVELRVADLCFTVDEATQFLNEVMGLDLDAGSIAVLEERTEGWIAGLQMAALSMRDRPDVPGFIRGFSGTNRYILDYLLEEVLSRQSPKVRRFLLHTSILERLSAPLCDTILADEKEQSQNDDRSALPESHDVGQSAAVLEYLERANLFLVPLDDGRTWYRYHHLFADLLRAQIQRSLGAQGVAQLHLRAADWYAQSGSILDAIHHASAALDDERVECLIEQHYREMVSRGEMSGYRFWTGRLSRELVHSRPWLCIYEAYSHAWFGELDEAERLLQEAEERISPEMSDPATRSMRVHLAYVKSRVTAMRGDIRGAIELCLVAREFIPADNLALQFDTLVTLGYEYFLSGDYANASRILGEAIQSGTAAGAIINTVAASCIMARLYAAQGLLSKSYDTYQRAAQLIPESSGEHRDAKALVEVGIADVLCEWNDLDAALVHLQQGLALLPMWAKVDDSVLAYITCARIHLAQANRNGATEAVERAMQFVGTSGIFSEARLAAEVAQVKLWLALGDLRAAARWIASQEDPFQIENELASMTRARALVALSKSREALALLLQLEEAARSAGRAGRVIELLLLQALAMQEIGDSEQAIPVLTRCLTLAEPEGYVRVFLDEGQPMQMLLARWLARADAGPVKDYARYVLSHFDAEPRAAAVTSQTALSVDDSVVSPAEPSRHVHSTGPVVSPAELSGYGLVEPLSERELEVLRLIALGKTNPEIAKQLVIARGTVKAHAAHIYQKLDVGNRTEAVARARQLGILP